MQNQTATLTGGFFMGEIYETDYSSWCTREVRQAIQP